MFLISSWSTILKHVCMRGKLVCTVSQFSYAQLFQGRHFLTIMLESNMLYNNLLICILSVWWHRKISESLMRIILPSKAILQKCTCNLGAYIFHLRFALGIIHGDSCDRKTPKTIVLFKLNNFFRSLNFITPLLFEEMLVFDAILTSVTIIEQVFLFMSHLLT